MSGEGLAARLKAARAAAISTVEGSSDSRKSIVAAFKAWKKQFSTPVRDFEKRVRDLTAPLLASLGTDNELFDLNLLLRGSPLVVFRARNGFAFVNYDVRENSRISTSPVVLLRHNSMTRCDGHYRNGAFQISQEVSGSQETPLQYSGVVIGRDTSLLYPIVARRESRNLIGFDLGKYTNHRISIERGHEMQVGFLPWEMPSVFSKLKRADGVDQVVAEVERLGDRAYRTGEFTEYFREGQLIPPGFDNPPSFLEERRSYFGRLLPHLEQESERTVDDMLEYLRAPMVAADQADFTVFHTDAATAVNEILGALSEKGFIQGFQEDIPLTIPPPPPMDSYCERS